MRHLLPIAMLIVLWPMSATAQDLGDFDPYGGPEQFIKMDHKKAAQKKMAKKNTTAAPKKKTKLRRIGGGEALVEYLRGVCGKDVRVEDVKDRSGTHHVAECSFCPKGSSDPGGKLRAHGGYVGDFSGDGHAEAILATSGCGAGFNFMDSVVVLRRKSDHGWKMLKYVDATSARNCTPVHGPSRDLLLCPWTESGGGSSTTHLATNYVENGKLSGEELTTFHDNTGSCHFEGDFKRTGDVQVVDDIDGDGKTEIALGITTVSGIPKADVSSIEAKCDESNWKFKSRKTLEVWEVGLKGIHKDAEAAKSTKLAKLRPYKQRDGEKK